MSELDDLEGDFVVPFLSAVSPWRRQPKKKRRPRPTTKEELAVKAAKERARRAELKQRGECVICERPVKAGSANWCEEHYLVRVARRKELDERRRDRGLCRVAGCPVAAVSGIRLCEKHRGEVNAKQRSRYGRRALVAP